MIKIKVYDNTVAEISMQYNQFIIEKIKSLPTRTYNPTNHTWSIPYCFLDKFLGSLCGLTYDITYESKVVSDEALKFDFKTKPFQHQIEAFVYGTNREKFLLADEPGLGKSKQSIDIAVYKKLAYNYKHCLIICGVLTLTYNWKTEISRHSDEGSVILGERYTKLGSIKIDTSKKLDFLEDIDNLPYFIITNIETLRNAKILDKIKQLIEDKHIEMIIFDEFHKVKNPDTKQGKALLSLRTDTRIALTGTPLMNNPLDLYSVLNWLDVEKHNFYMFRNYFCILDKFKKVIGFKHLDELNSMLDSVMLRRKKNEVLDLPPKIRTTEYLLMDKEQQRVYDDVKQKVLESIDKVEKWTTGSVELIRLRQATGFTGILSSDVRLSVKYDRTFEIIDEAISNNDKVIVFSNWTSVLNPLYNALLAEGYNPAIITGEIEDRKGQELKFLKDDSCKVMLGSIGAMGVGLTLTSAQTVVFLDSPWNRATKEQCEDRCHRIGTSGTVNIITLVCKDTVDELVEAVIEEKGELSDRIVDGKESSKIKGIIRRLFDVKT